MVVGVFGLAELLLWAAGTETVLESQDPFRGFSGLVKVFEADGETFRTRQANLQTFNEQSFLKEKPENGLRIFSLGGSSSHGFPWGAEVAFTSVLGELLAASHDELTVEAVNVSGVSYAMHRLNIIADELLRYDPDIFVIYSGHNEFIEPVFMEALKHRNPVRTQVEYWAAHSRIYSSIWHAVHRRDEQAPSAEVSATVLRDHGIFSAAQKAEVVEEYRSRLRRLVRIAQEAGARVVLSTVPCNQREWSPEASAAVSDLGEADRQAWSVAFARGKRLLQEQQGDSALESLERAVTLAPDHAESQYLLGKCYDLLGRWPDAQQAYERAVDADASPIRRLSGINTAIRDIARERETLLVDADRVFTEQSEHGLLGFNLIKDYVHPTEEGHQLIAWHLWDAIERSGWLGESREASRDLYAQVIASRPKIASTGKSAWFFNQGVLLEKQGQLQAAADNYLEAIRLSPDYVAAMKNLGGLLARMGQPQEALQVLQTAVRRDPKFPGLHNNVGGVLQMLGRLPEALAEFRADLAITPDQPDVHLNLGITLQRIGRLPEARQAYQDVLRLEPDSADAHMYLGSLMLQQSQLDQAVVHFRQAQELNPDQAHSYSNLGVALLRQKNYAEAATQFQKAIALQPDYAVAHKNLGLALAPQGLLAEAVRHFERALQLDPTVPGVQEPLNRARAGLEKR